MNIQVIDDSGTVRFRTSDCETVGEVLLGALGFDTATTETLPDVALSAEKIDALRGRIDEELRQRVAAIGSGALSAFTTSVSVFGKVYHLYPLDSEQRDILRLVDFEEVTEQAMRERFWIYFVPELGMARFMLLDAAKNAVRLLSRRELRATALGELARLSAVEGVTSDGLRLYREAAAALRDDAWYKDAVNVLAAARLLSLDAQGLIGATEKLHRVTL